MKRLFCFLVLVSFAGAAEPGQVPPTFKAVRYGPHERNVLNVWLAKSDRPTPVIFKIHGGGWLSGDMQDTEPQKGWLDIGISVVSIRYRLTTTDILPAPVHDAARALQFVRHMAKEWKLDPRRVVCMGGSAGACTSLWLALHDDLADPASTDPVARQSTKPLGVVANNAQSTLDPFWIEEHIGPEAARHAMPFKAVGATSLEDYKTNYARYRALALEFSPMAHLDRSDPPLYLTANDDLTVPAKNPSHGIHHANFALKLKEQADALGVTCHVVLRGPGRQQGLSAREFVMGLFR